LTENCLACNTPLPEPRRASRKYCDQKCRAKFQRAVALEKKPDQSPTKISDAQKQMKALAFENLGDEVRQILREEIRETISQHVKDNVLGAAEVMTHMLPTAMAAMKQDLESEDWMSRSRAYALVMKYAMAFAEADGKDEKPQNIVVVSGVPTPDTPFGHAVVERLDELPNASASYNDDDVIEGEVLEDFEMNWPKCHYCHQRKPEANMTVESHGEGNKTRNVCTSCSVARHYKRGQGAPDKITEDKLFGPD
jgi:hypothetical protein